MRKADIVGYREQDVPTLRIWDDPGQRAWTGDTPVPTSSPTHQQDGERVVRQFNVHQPVEQSIESILDNVASARGLTRDKLVAILHDLEHVGLIEPAPR